MKESHLIPSHELCPVKALIDFTLPTKKLMKVTVQDVKFDFVFLLLAVAQWQVIVIVI